MSIMKFLTLLSLATLAACSSCAHTDNRRTDTSTQPGTALLAILDENGEKKGTCSAWKIDDDLIGTAGHCCAPGKTYILQGPNAVPGAEAHVLVDLKENDDDGVWTHDVCIMRGQIRGESIRIATKDPAIGAHVWTLGYPRGDFLISEGIWSGRNDAGEGMCSSVVASGASGSPILDADNRAVGIAVAGYRGQDNMTFVANLEKLRFAIKKARLIKDEIGE